MSTPTGSATTVAPPAPTGDTAAQSDTGRRRTSGRFGRPIVRDPAAVSIRVLAAISLIVLAWPVAALVIGAFHDTPPGEPARWGIAAFQRAFDNPHLGTAVLNTIVFTAIVVPSAVAVGLVLALIGTSSNARLGRIIGPTVVIAYAMPPMFYAIGYALAGSGRSGTVNDLLNAIAGIDPVLNATSWPGLLFVSIMRAGAYCYLLLIGPVRALSRSQVEAVRAAGGRSLIEQLRVGILPSLRPAIGGAVILALISHIGLFDAIYILGNAAGITTVSVLSYRLLQIDGTPDFSAASVTGLFILVLAVILVIVQQRRFEVRAAVTVSGKPERPITITFSPPVRGALDGLIVAYVIAFLVIPVGSIVLTSVQRFPGLYTGLTGRFYQDLFASSDAINALLTTFALGILGGGLGVALALAIVAARVTRPDLPSTTVVAAAAMAPVALSGIVGALGYIWAVVLFEPTRWLYGSFLLLVIALAAGVVPASMMLLTGSISQVDPGLLASARASGDSWPRAFLSIVVPVVAPSLINTWFLSFITVIGALDLTLVLSGPHIQPASTFIYRAYANAGFGPATAMLVLLLIGLIALRLLLQLILRRLRPDLATHRREA